LLITTIELEKLYDVIVVFDPTIRSLLQANDSLIKSQFNNDIKVHIVTSKRQADESILDIASNDDLCYVLSNDRFGEYKDKEVVMNNRLIQHEIVDQRVMIHDLKINALCDYGVKLN